MDAVRTFNLTKEFNGLVAVNGVDLEINKGELFSLLGPNGAGKTTLCLTLNGILPHLVGGTFRGKVVVAGMDTRDHGPGEMSRQVGLVFQDPESQLFNMTVEDEVVFGLESLGLSPAEMEERIAWALEVVRLTGLRKRHPLQLSGGQKKRLAIATVLAMRPQVLVLDEPVTGLDPLGRHEVLSVIEQLKQEEEVTVVMVEQDAEAVMAWADHVVIMEDIVLGERVRAYQVEGLVPGGQWQKLCEGISIGHKRIQPVAPVEVAGVRLRVSQSVATPQIRRLAVYSPEPA